MKKNISSLFSLFFLLSVLSNAAFAGNLSVEPSYLNPTIPSGRLDVNELHITNYGEVPLTIKSDFNSQWMWVVPAEFDLSSGMARDITTIFFIPRGEEPKREGEIVFTSDGEQAKIRVVVSAPIEETKEVENKTSEESKPAKKDLTPIFNLFAKDLAEEMKRGDVQLCWTDEDILITIPGRIIFNPGQSYPQEKGLAVLYKVGSILRKEKESELESIQIKGHADSSPICGILSNKFPSNWELASTRSAAAARILEYKTGVNGRRLVAAGYSSNIPISDNATVDGRTQNRRLEIIISAQ